MQFHNCELAVIMQETGSNRQEDEEDDSVATEDNFMSSNSWDEIPQDNFTVLVISEAFEIPNSINIQEEDLNGHIAKLKTKLKNIFAKTDSPNS